MKLEDLLSILTGNSIDFSLGDYEDIVLIEKDDEEYYNVKEIYWLPNKRVVIRLGEKHDA